MDSDSLATISTMLILKSLCTLALFLISACGVFDAKSVAPGGFDQAKWETAQALSAERHSKCQDVADFARWGLTIDRSDLTVRPAASQHMIVQLASDKLTIYWELYARGCEGEKSYMGDIRYEASILQTRADAGVLELDLKMESMGVYVGSMGFYKTLMSQALCGFSDWKLLGTSWFEKCDSLEFSFPKRIRIKIIDPDTYSVQMTEDSAETVFFKKRPL